MPYWIKSLQDVKFTVLQYTSALSSIIISFCVIFDISYMMNLPFYIYSRILQVLISKCRIEFNNYKTRITVLQYSTILSNLITSFCIIFDICYMMNLPFYIYSSALPVLISTCCIEFNNYKTRITVLQYSTILSNLITSFCIIFDICYMMNLPFYIYSSTFPVLISTCSIEFNNYKSRITVLQDSTTLSNLIISFCIIFDIFDTWWTNSTMYIPEYSQYWFKMLYWI